MARIQIFFGYVYWRFSHRKFGDSDFDNAFKRYQGKNLCYMLIILPIMSLALVLLHVLLHLNSEEHKAGVLLAVLATILVIENTIMKRVDKLFKKFQENGITLKYELAMYACIAFAVSCVGLAIYTLPHK